jgi:hypothetical protein
MRCDSTRGIEEDRMFVEIVEEDASLSGCRKENSMLLFAERLLGE